MAKEPLRPAPLRSSTPLRMLHGDGLGVAYGELVEVLDGDSPSDMDAVADAVAVTVGDGSVYAHHKPDAHAEKLNWAVATK